MVGKELIQDYTFSASALTVTFDSMTTPRQEAILMITNTLDNVIIYNFADPAKGGTLAGNVLSVAYDTTLMSDTDPLEIWYWVDGLTTKVRAKATDPNITYIGKVDPGNPTSATMWQIKRIVKNGASVDIEFANGSPSYSNIFDNRESLSYS